MSKERVRELKVMIRGLRKEIGAYNRPQYESKNHVS